MNLIHYKWTFLLVVLIGLVQTYLTVHAGILSISPNLAFYSKEEAQTAL